jgi:aryl-alcohol dehydrogenase-like predicted oxidoreductase
MVVASKWGYTYTADWQRNPDVHEVKDHSGAALDRQLAETHALIGDRLDLYQIHSATLDTGVLDDPDVIHRLRELKRSGVAVGLSTSGPAQRDTIRKALTVEDGNGALLFDAIQATWNLLERSAAPALAEAAAAGVTVIVKEAMANGRLGPRGDTALADADGPWGPDAVALAAALRQPWTAVVLSGAATPSQLADNVLAYRVTAATVDLALEANAPEAPDAYWSHRAGLTWT